MTSPDSHEIEQPFSHKKYWAQLIGWSVLLTFVLIGGLLAFAALGNFFEDGGDQSDLVFLFVGSPLVLVGGYFTWKWLPDFTMGEPYTARGIRVRWMSAAVVLVGIVIAIPIVSSSPEDSLLTLYSNGPMPFAPAMLAIAVWAVAMPFLIIFGRRNADEHALQASDYGMMVGFQIFYYAAPIWWMGWRAGVLPAPDVMILFIFIGLISSAVILWKRAG